MSRLLSRVVILPIRAYQIWHAGRPSPCRFVPSCSDYAIEVITARGALRGGWLAFRRILRCRPLGGYGFDPVSS
jgi:putative membrane protein insertion efficiency factor